MKHIRVDYHRMQQREPAIVVVQEDESFSFHSVVRILGPSLVVVDYDLRHNPRIWVETNAELEVM